VDRILKTGATQAVVLGWKSILLGARGDSAGALARAQEAVASGGRTSGFAQYALGAALLATGDTEGAQRALREAQSLSPALLAAQVRLAELEARSGAIVSARERLQRVIVLDPEYASAWRSLYLLPPEGGSDAMRVLVLGSGGREHALAWKLAQSPKLTALICAPGNPGTATFAENRPVAPDHPEAVVAVAREAR